VPRSKYLAEAYEASPYFARPNSLLIRRIVLFYIMIMDIDRAKLVRKLCTASIGVVLLAGYFVVIGMAESRSSSVGANIGAPIVLLLLAVQLVLSITGLVIIRHKKNT